MYTLGFKVNRRVHKMTEYKTLKLLTGFIPIIIYNSKDPITTNRNLRRN